MKVALVNLWKGSHPLLGLAYLPAYYRENGKNRDNVRFFLTEAERGKEKNTLKKLKAINPKIIGFHSYTPNYNSVRRFAAEVKRQIPNVITLIGGPHVSSMPNVLDKEFDYAMIGEGETSFMNLIDSIYSNNKTDKTLSSINGITYRNKKESIKHTGCAQMIHPLDNIPFPARDLLDRKELLKPTDVLTIQKNLVGTNMFTSRGCPYSCIYCQSKTIFPRARFHSAKYVVDEIEHLYSKYKVEAIAFNDDLFMLNKKRLEEMVTLLKERKLINEIMFFGSGRANMVTKDTVKLLKEMGVVQLNMGFETGSERMLKYLKQNTVTQQHHQTSLELLHKAGIFVYASFMLGNPTETKQEMYETIKLMSDPRIRIATVNITTPLPGTHIWELAKQDGVVKDNMNWDMFFDSIDDPRSQIYMNTVVPHKEFVKIFKKAQNVIMRKAASNWEGLSFGQMVSKFLKHPGNNLRFFWNNKAQAIEFVKNNIKAK